MMQYARTLANSKLRNDRHDLAKAVFDITSSRFDSPKHSVRILKTYMVEPAYQIWKKGGSFGPMKQCIVLKAMLLATGKFTADEVDIMKSPLPYFAAAAKEHFFLRVRIGGNHITQDPWGRNWKIEYGARFGGGKMSVAFVPQVYARWDEKVATGGDELYLKK